jgi:hypothetical protein
MGRKSGNEARASTGLQRHAQQSGKRQRLLLYFSH